MNTQTWDERLDGEGLLADVAWLRRIARGLVGDATVGDDLAQEAWTKLIGKRRRPERLRPYLMGMVKKLALEQRRGARRRTRHEEAVAREGARADGADPARTLERIELQKGILDALSGLPETQREVLVLRYLDGLEPAEIAARLGTPAGTVRSQLKRGLDDLRRRLDEETPGGRERWLAALAPFAVDLPVALTAPALPAALLLVAMKITLVVAAAVLITVSLVTLLDHGDELVDPDPVLDRAAALELEVDGGEAIATTGAVAVDSGDGSFTSRRQAVPEAAPTTLRGRVVDRAGNRVADGRLGLALVPAGITTEQVYAGAVDLEEIEAIPVGRTRSDETGAFVFEGLELDPDRHALALNVEAPGYSDALLLLEHIPREEVRFVIDAVYADGILAGRSADEYGTPIEEFTVEILVRQERRKGEIVASRMEAITAHEFTSADGTFKLEVPIFVRSRGRFDVRVSAPGFRATSREFDSATYGAEGVTLFTLDTAGVLRGHIRGTAGEPIAGAQLRPTLQKREGKGIALVFGEREISDEQGNFRLGDLPPSTEPIGGGEERYWIQVEHPEYGSVRFGASELDLEAGEFVITMPPLTVLEGRVLGLADASGVSVRAAERDLVGQTGLGPAWKRGARVEDDGSFHFPDVPAGTLYLTVHRFLPDGGEWGGPWQTLSAVRMVTVGEGETNQVEFNVDGAGRLTGRFEIEGWEDDFVYSAILRVEGSGGALHSVTSGIGNGNRSFCLPNLTVPGRAALLRIHLSPELWLEHPLTPRAGDFELGTISARFEDFTGGAPADR
jgi:RNA polymerase sigma factor (sigma-70 family)